MIYAVATVNVDLGFWLNDKIDTHPHTHMTSHAYGSVQYQLSISHVIVILIFSIIHAFNIW